MRLYCSICGCRLGTEDEPIAASKTVDYCLQCWDADGTMMPETQRLRLALQDALDGMEDMVCYVEPYFQEKWEHQGYIERARAALQMDVVREQHDEG